MKPSAFHRSVLCGAALALIQAPVHLASGAAPQVIPIMPQACPGCKAKASPNWSMATSVFSTESMTLAVTKTGGQCLEWFVDGGLALPCSQGFNCRFVATLTWAGFSPGKYPASFVAKTPGGAAQYQPTAPSPEETGAGKGSSTWDLGGETGARWIRCGSSALEVSVEYAPNLLENMELTTQLSCAACGS